MHFKFVYCIGNGGFGKVILDVKVFNFIIGLIGTK